MTSISAASTEKPGPRTNSAAPTFFISMALVIWGLGMTQARLPNGQPDGRAAEA